MKTKMEDLINNLHEKVNGETGIKARLAEVLKPLGDIHKIDGDNWNGKAATRIRILLHECAAELKESIAQMVDLRKEISEKKSRVITKTTKVE